MSSFQQAVLRREWRGVLQASVMYAALWAIGSSWSATIRIVVDILLPEDNAILAAFSASMLTTLIAVGAACGVTQLTSSFSSSSGEGVGARREVEMSRRVGPSSERTKRNVGRLR